MRTVTKYECEKCGIQYDDRNACATCEDAHPTLDEFNVVGLHHVRNDRGDYPELMQVKSSRHADDSDIGVYRFSHVGDING